MQGSSEQFRALRGASCIGLLTWPIQKSAAHGATRPVNWCSRLLKMTADNPAAALALDELFAEKAGRLVDHPGLGRLGRVAGTRELVAHQNYILVYDVAGDLVRVLRVLHAARQWPPARR